MFQNVARSEYISAEMRLIVVKYMKDFQFISALTKLEILLLLEELSQLLTAK